MCGYFCIGLIDFMPAGKTLIDYTSLCLPYDFAKTNKIILMYFKISEVHTAHLNLTDQREYRLNEIEEIKNYFTTETQERELMSKKLTKYIATFDYFDQSLIILSALSEGMSIISFASIIGVPVGIVSASVSLIFSFNTGIIKKLLKTTKQKQIKRRNIIKLLC